MTSLSCPDFVVVDPVNGMVGLVEKTGEIDGLTIGRVDDGVDGEMGDSGGIGAAIVGSIVLRIVLRKRSP